MYADRAVKLLDLLKGEVEGIRNLMTCKICFGLLYEPFTTSCGHTFCYNCFVRTFESHKPKNCPECRTRVNTAPTPSFLLKEITRRFIKRAELLPEDETVELHSEWLKEHEEIVKKDRDGRHGIFRGLFIKAGRKCPYCVSELDHDICRQCGYSLDDGDDSFPDSYSEQEMEGFSISEETDDFDMDDGDDVFGDEFEDEYDDDMGYGEDYRFASLVPYVMDDLARIDDDDDIPYSLNRYLEQQNPQSYRTPSHSLAGSLGSLYASSTVSTYRESEMGTVEEEEEEEEEEEAEEEEEEEAEAEEQEEEEEEEEEEDEDEDEEEEERE
jgi:hypothetical protein